MPQPLRDNGAAVTLYSAAVTTAGTATGGTVANLGGVRNAHVLCALTYGSGGTAITAYVQTSLNAGTSWMDIAAVTFGTVTAKTALRFNGTASGTAFLTPTDGSLTANTMVDGVLGDRFRVKVVSTGTYAGNTSLAVTASVKS